MQRVWHWAFLFKNGTKLCKMVIDAYICPGNNYKLYDCFALTDPSYFLSHFYIKPQLPFLYIHRTFRCFLSHFYIKPQPVFNIMLIFSIIASKHRTGSDIYLM